jgi:hypothetical protein
MKIEGSFFFQQGIEITIFLKINHGQQITNNEGKEEQFKCIFLQPMHLHYKFKI